MYGSGQENTLSFVFVNKLCLFTIKRLFAFFIFRFHFLKTEMLINKPLISREERMVTGNYHALTRKMKKYFSLV